MAQDKDNFQNAVQFLMYSYFGKWEDDPLQAAISRAYRDATMRNAFIFQKEKKDDKDALEIYGGEIIRKEIIYNIEPIDSNPYMEKNKKAHNRAKEIFDTDKIDELKKELEKIKKNIKNDGGNDFDEWHKRLCKELVAFYHLYDKNSSFSFGNAQKWVNMTMKYLYIMSLSSLFLKSNNTPSWCKNILEDSKYFHIPLDSYILKAVFYADRRNAIDQDKKLILVDQDIEGSKYVYSDGSLNLKQWENSNEKFTEKYSKSSVAWSKILCYRDYELIQNKITKCIPENMLPLEWENQVWIKSAKAEK